MIDELVKTIRLHLSERLTSPLLGAFVTSWCVWNYRVLMVLFSGEPLARKFGFLDNTIYPNVWQSLTFGFALPAITAAAYLFLYPYPSKIVYEFTRKKQREILDIRRRIEGETPLTIEDSKKIRGEHALAEQTYSSELDRKDREIEKLKTQVGALQDLAVARAESGVAGASNANRHENARLAEELLDMLKLIEQSGGVISESTAIKKSGAPKIEAEFALGELRRLELATRTLDRQSGANVYKFTHSGRAALISARNSGPDA
jgi:hypothetical protein